MTRYIAIVIAAGALLAGCGRGGGPLVRLAPTQSGGGEAVSDNNARGDEMKQTAEPYEWQGGGVFREYTFFGPDAPGHNHTWPVKIEEIDPGSKFSSKDIPTVADRVARARSLRVLTIEKGDAVRAELLLELTNCHIATPGWFTYNHKQRSRSWLPLPREVGTPGPPELYHHTILGSRVVPLNMDWLLEGENTFQFTAGPQMKYSWDFGCFWMYDFTVRVYHPRRAEHPAAAIVNIPQGSLIGENQEIVVEVTPGGAPIRRVDVFAFYEGFNESGSGLLREWHGQLRYGVPHLHVGSSTEAPYRITWNTEWVPDQNRPVRLVARAIDEAGWHTVSPVVENLTFKRAGRSVRMFQALDVPERFSVKDGQVKQCGFQVDNLPKKSVRALIAVNTSFGGEALESIMLNGAHLVAGIGRQNRYNTDFIDVPVDLIKQGYNIFSVRGAKTSHGPEFDWPGPALLVESVD